MAGEAREAGDTSSKGWGDSCLEPDPRVQRSLRLKGCQPWNLNFPAEIEHDQHHFNLQHQFNRPINCTKQMETVRQSILLRMESARVQAVLLQTESVRIQVFMI